MAVTDAGDEVLIPDPGWPNYEAIVHLAGAVPVRFSLPAQRGFMPDPAEIARLGDAAHQGHRHQLARQPDGRRFFRSADGRDL